MGRFVSRLGHESLYLLAYLFEDFLDGPAFFFEIEVFFWKFDEDLDFIAPSLFFEQGGLHYRSRFDDVAVNLTKRM